MKMVRALVGSAFVALIAVYALAEEKKCCSGTCPSTKTVAVAGSCEGGGCPIAAAMGELPKMTYTVGDETTCCSKSATAMAEKADQPISFVVGDKKFDKEHAAFVALVEQTESFVTKFTTLSKCEKSGVTTIAGKSCACPVEAGKTASRVKDAVGKVHFTYLVGDKECHCPNEAKELASKSGAKTVYVVAGEKTSCDLTARLNLARAKYKAAVETLVSANDKADTNSDS